MSHPTSPTNELPHLRLYSYLIFNQWSTTPPINESPQLQPISYHIQHWATPSFAHEPPHLQHLSYHISNQWATVPNFQPISHQIFSWRVTSSPTNESPHLTPIKHRCPLSEAPCTLKRNEPPDLQTLSHKIFCNLTNTSLTKELPYSNIESPHVLTMSHQVSLVKSVFKLSKKFLFIYVNIVYHDFKFSKTKVKKLLKFAK